MCKTVGLNHSILHSIILSFLLSSPPGVYDWTGVNSLCPEIWLLPTALPFSPTKFWCHSRMVYLPMSYLYGKRATCPIDELTHELRAELFAGAQVRRPACGQSIRMTTT